MLPHADRMANSIDSDQTALQEQTDLGIHSMYRTCLNTLSIMIISDNFIII